MIDEKEEHKVSVAKSLLDKKKEYIDLTERIEESIKEIAKAEHKKIMNEILGYENTYGRNFEADEEKFNLEALQWGT